MEPVVEYSQWANLQPQVATTNVTDRYDIFDKEKADNVADEGAGRNDAGASNAARLFAESESDSLNAPSVHADDVDRSDDSFDSDAASVDAPVEVDHTSMLIRSLVDDGLVPVRPSDTVEHALDLLLEVRVRHLPVVESPGTLVGMVSEDQLLNAAGPDARVSTLLGYEPISGSPDLHIFEATKIMSTHALTVLPIATPDRKYIGAVRRHDIFDRFAKMLSTNESGAILALEVYSRDYSLSKLVYSIEQNDVKILSIATETPEGDGVVRVTLKLDVKDTSRVRHVLEHAGYRVVAAFSEEGSNDDLRFRVEEFMRYLEV